MLLRSIYENFGACCEDYMDGIQHLKNHSMNKAAHSFDSAYQSVDPGSKYRNKYASYTGLSRVLSGDRTGIELCREAAENEVHDGDVYLNLARAEWFLENRQNTIAVLKKGLKCDPEHRGLIQMRQQLGVRERTAVPFLPRGHQLNRALGELMREDNQPDSESMLQFRFFTPY